MNNLQENKDDAIRIRYNLQLKVNDIDLVGKYIEASYPTPVYIDPLYLVIVKEYMDMLGINEGNTLDISETIKIRKILEKYRKLKKNTHVYCVSDPVSMIRRGINAICDVLPYYMSVQNTLS